MTKARVNQWWVSGFTADTPVLMADGKTKSISKVQEGEWVASFDPETAQLMSGLVTGKWSEVMNDILEIEVDDQKMTVASSQRFYTASGEFKTAPDAELVLTQNGPKPIKAKKQSGKVKLYDITVKDSHAFFANGLMVHNKGGRGRPPAQPAPAPDPVVTAGKVGQPLTVTVNGNVVEVPASPDSASYVSVSYTGGVNTGVHSVPGVAPIRGVMPLRRFPRSAPQLSPLNSVVAAEEARAVFCASAIGTSGAVNAATKNTWQTQLNTIKQNLLAAQRSSGVIAMRCGVGNGTSSRRSADNNTDYDTSINEVADLSNFIKKNKNFTAKDQAVIDGKCSSIATSISRIKAGLDARWTAPPIDPPSAPGNVYFTDPRYAYFESYALGGSGVYIYSPPGTSLPAIAPLPQSYYWYRSIDSANPQPYYTKLLRTA